MTTVFVAGSINIKKLHPQFSERISNVVKSQLNIVVGDADGADKSIQKFLFEKNAASVTIFCSGASPRNNVGHWPVHNIFPKAEKGSRAFYTAKDLEMAKVADYGLMVWDGQSTGTLNNVIELLKARKKCVVFVSKDKDFVNVTVVDDLIRLVGKMSELARSKAEQKINLASKIASLAPNQMLLEL